MIKQCFSNIYLFIAADFQTTLIGLLNQRCLFASLSIPP
jgi:hypothetical protein